MWSIALICGVAGIASLTLLVTGVSLAITIERRRYRRYIQRHTAGTSTATDTESNPISEETNVDIAESQILPKKSSLAASETWITLLSPARIEVDGSTGLIPGPTSKLELARQKSLHKTLRSTITKRRSQRRCLQKKRTHRKHTNTPLSPITEMTDCTTTSPAGQSESPVFSPQQSIVPGRRSETYRWPFDEQEPQVSNAEGVVHHALDNRNFLSHRPQSIGLDISPCSRSPVAQIMSPTMESSCTNRPRTVEQRMSMSTMESMGSSILRTSPTAYYKVAQEVEKTQSQALEDFNFDLSSSILELKSAKVKSSPTMYDPRYTTTNSQRTSMSSQLEPVKPLRIRARHDIWPLNKDLGTTRTTSLSLGPSGRYSMIENVEMLLDRPAYNSNHHEYANDPFVTDVHSPSASVESRVSVQDLHVKASAQPTSSHLHPCETITMQSRRPSLPPVEKLHKVSMASNSTRNAGLSMNVPKRDSHVSKLSHDMTTRGSPKATRSKSTRLQTSYDEDNSVKRVSTVTSGSNTSSRNYQWKFDFILANSPKPSTTTSSPLRSYDSPVLPSPAYTPANLYPKRLQTKVMGPRSPRRPQPQSPLNPNCKVQSRVHGLGAAKLQKRIVSNDLLRSIQVLRSMSSENQLANMNKNAGPSRRPSRKQSESKRVAGQDVAKAHKRLSQLSFTSHRTFSRKLSPSNTVNNNLIPRTQSPESLDGISVWEDDSVYDDSPKSEMLKSIPPMGQAFLASSAPSAIDEKSRHSYNKYNTKSHDQENGVKPTMTSEQKVGLGLRFVEAMVPDTPRSMYDKQGFLRE